MRQQTIPGFLHGHHRIDKRTNVAHQNFPLFDRKSVKRISDLAQKLLNTAINLAHSPTPPPPPPPPPPPKATPHPPPRGVCLTLRHNRTHRRSEPAANCILFLQ